MRLFVDRAGAQVPDLAANAGDERIVGEICRHLDGMPLAIELAAARLTVLSPPEILDGLRQRFQLLRGRDPSAPARQRTMQGLLDWDYELLSDAEQAALARLSVFSGSFDLRAASAAVGHSGFEAADVPDLVWSLSDSSLVNVERTAGNTRYRLLETVRAYADEKLGASGDGAATRRALAGHYLDRFPPSIRGQREWINGVVLETDTMVDLVSAPRVRSAGRGLRARVDRERPSLRDRPARAGPPGGRLAGFRRHRAAAQPGAAALAHRRSPRQCGRARRGRRTDPTGDHHPRHRGHRRIDGAR